MPQLTLNFHLPNTPLGITLGCLLFLNFLQKSFSSLGSLSPSQPPWILSVLPHFLPPRNRLWLQTLKSCWRASHHQEGPPLNDHVTEAFLTFVLLRVWACVHPDAGCLFLLLKNPRLTWPHYSFGQNIRSQVVICFVASQPSKLIRKLWTAAGQTVK